MQWMVFFVVVVVVVFLVGLEQSGFVCETFITYSIGPLYTRIDIG